MKIRGDQEKLLQLKEERTLILESAKFPVHKWQSNVKPLKSENMPNPGKVLDTLGAKMMKHWSYLQSPFHRSSL